MGHSKSNDSANANATATATNTQGTGAQAHEVEVLYQKMGDRWFAFSLIDDEVFVGSITQDEINAAEAQAQTQTGNKGPIIGSS